MKSMRNTTDSVTGVPGTSLDSQSGVGILGVIAMLGLIFALVQGTVFYRAKSSSKFMSAEKGKILAQQAADAGVEENIADLGTRKLRPHPGMHEHTTYTAKQIGNSTFTTKVTALGMGSDGDTIQLTSKGNSSGNFQMVRAKMRIKQYLDSTPKPLIEVKPETTITNVSVSLPETTVTTVVQDPNTMPVVDETPAYSACMSSGDKKCQVCHIPPGNFANRHVIEISKNAIKTHVNHHGDYVTTDGTCDIYNPRQEETITNVTKVISDTLIVDKTIYDTVMVIDTLARVQILNWK